MKLVQARHLKRMLAHVKASSGNSECVVCLERAAKAVLAPCGHRCVCAEHAASLVGKACPVCRAAVESYVTRIYQT